MLTLEEKQAVKKVVDLANNGDQGAQKLIDDLKRTHYETMRNEGNHVR